MVAILEGIRPLIFGTSTVEDSGKQNNNIIVGDNSNEENRENQPTVCDSVAQESNQSAVEPTQSNTDVDPPFKLKSGRMTSFYHNIAQQLHLNG